MFKLDLTNRVKELAQREEIDYVGVAAEDRFSKAPLGHRPRDLLEKCRSIISIGIKIGEGVREAHGKAYSGLRHGIYIYKSYGYTILNEKLAQCALKLARFLEKEGYRSIPIPPSSPSDPYKLMGAFSNRHAAVAAGLGEFGWNTLLVTPDAGPRVRVATILTTAELIADPMYTGKKLCKREKCDVCISICPLNAISANRKVKVEIGRRSFEYAVLNKRRCWFGGRGMTHATLGRSDIPVPPEPKPSDLIEANSKVNPWQVLEGMYAFCGRCIINCPIPNL